MAEESSVTRENFSKMSKAAFIVGYTGEVGKELVKEVVRSPRPFSKVVLIGRRKVEFDDERKDLEQKVVDFDKLDEYADEFKGFDTGFVALGTTRAKSGKEAFYKVDHDYIMHVGKLAKAGGLKDMHLVSSVGADKASSFLYQRVKGEVEAEMADLNFERLAIYRPGMLLCDREETRVMEGIARFLFKPIAAAFPTSGSVPTSTVAKAILNVAVTPFVDKVQLFDNKGIHVVSGTLKKK